jgi:CheY-like chemotaxis protein
MHELGQGTPRSDKDDWVRHQILLALNEFADLTEGEFFFFQENVLKAPELGPVNVSNIVLDHGLKADQIALILAHQRDETQHGALKSDGLPMESPVQVPSRHSVFGKPASLVAPSPPKVLFVDDEAPVREIAGEVLRDAGYDVHEASSPEEAADIATELVRSEQKDFTVVTDLLMPTTTKQSFEGGVELVQILQELGIDVPVLLTTEKLHDEFQTAVKRLRIRKVVFKPSLSKLDPEQYQTDLRSFASVIVKLLKELDPEAAETHDAIENGKDPWARRVLTSMGAQLTDPESAIRIANHVLPVAASIAPKENGGQDILEEGTRFRPSDGAHLRKHERIGSLKFEARFNRGDVTGEGHLTDLSETGAFLQTDQLFPIGDFIRLHIILPYQLGEVATEARIVWINYQDSDHDPSPHGMGLAFVGPFA